MVGAGSFLGGAARYAISLAMKTLSKGFPWATLAANLIGCLLIGILWGCFSRSSNDGSPWALFMTVGFCGGFTTFSTFSHEAFRLFTQGHHLAALLYVAASLFAGVLGVAAGLFLAK